MFDRVEKWKEEKYYVEKLSEKENIVVKNGRERKLKGKK